MAEATIKLYPDLVQIVDERAAFRDQVITADYPGNGQMALIHFAFPDEIAYKKLDSAKLYLYIPSGRFFASVYFLNRSFTSQTTWVSAGVYKDPNISFNETVEQSGYASVNIPWTDRYYSGLITQALRYGLAIDPLVGETSLSLVDNPPYIELTYDDGDDAGVLVGGFPNYGAYAPKHRASEFRWSVSADGAIYGEYSIVASTFNWRPKAADTYTAVDVGSASSYTVPADTFTADEIYWFPRVTINTGKKVIPQYVFTVNTVEPLSMATPVSPINTIEDGSAPISFSWLVSNASGYEPTGADLQYSLDGSSWTTFGTVEGAETSYTALENTLPGGSLQWRVRAYNTDGAAGEWSEAVGFVSIAAPAAPVIDVDPVPFATIRWQSTGQEAYRVTIDGRVYGPYPGTGKSFQLSTPLSDGTHEAKVEIQGQFGLWSAPGSLSFSVTNVPGESLTLRGLFALDATLLWDTTEAESYQIYRDGKLIAQTTETQYTDRLSLGEHRYTVYAILPGGNYTRSNDVIGTTECRTMAVAPVEGGEWLELRTSSSSDRQERYTYSKTHSLRHFLGAEYPVLEESSFAELAGSYETAFMDKALADRFWALRGKTVILKARGEVTVGLLANVSKIVSNFLYSFTFELQQIHWEGLSYETNG